LETENEAPYVLLPHERNVMKSISWMQESQKVIQKHLGMDGGDSVLPNELCGHIPEAGSTQALMKCCVWT